MGVLVHVAVDAKFSGVTKYVGFVAAFALGIRVLPEQWETGQVVIEEHVFLPRQLVVAVFTGSAQFTLVRVVRGMAVVAPGG